jgi:hypothetical protein
MGLRLLCAAFTIAVSVAAGARRPKALAPVAAADRLRRCGQSSGNHRGGPRMVGPGVAGTTAPRDRRPSTVHRDSDCESAPAASGAVPNPSTESPSFEDLNDPTRRPRTPPADNSVRPARRVVLHPPLKPSAPPRQYRRRRAGTSSRARTGHLQWQTAYVGTVQVSTVPRGCFWRLAPSRVWALDTSRRQPTHD